MAPTTEQVPVFFRESVYRPYDAVSGLYRLALTRIQTIGEPPYTSFYCFAIYVGFGANVVEWKALDRVKSEL